MIFIVYLSFRYFSTVVSTMILFVSTCMITETHVFFSRNDRKPPATILIYSSCLVYVHTSGHIRTPVASATYLTLLKNLTNKVNDNEIPYLCSSLQKVLNATSDDVEQMLHSYTDVRTIATFATALKR